ncbi:MAG: hypothetical protein ABIT76_01310 [Chthoniobacterales bacterium]
MKIFLIGAFVLSLAVSSHAADGEKSVQELRDEIAQLKRSLAKAQDQSVTNFSASVELRSRYEAAIQRINEANDVARQWRNQAINLKHELTYTKAIAQSGAAGDTVDLVKVYAKSNVPHFRISDIPSREVPAPVTITNTDVIISPTYISMR